MQVVDISQSIWMDATQPVSEFKKCMVLEVPIYFLGDAVYALHLFQKHASISNFNTKGFFKINSIVFLFCRLHISLKPLLLFLIVANISSILMLTKNAVLI